MPAASFLSLSGRFGSALRDGSRGAFGSAIASSSFQNRTNGRRVELAARYRGRRRSRQSAASWFVAMMTVSGGRKILFHAAGRNGVATGQFLHPVLVQASALIGFRCSGQFLANPASPAFSVGVSGSVLILEKHLLGKLGGVFAEDVDQQFQEQGFPAGPRSPEDVKRLSE